jgi:four helix bundle protein
MENGEWIITTNEKARVFMTNKSNPVLEKSYAFALKIIRLYKKLTEDKREYVMSKQMLVHGTEIGEYVTIAQNANNRAMFHQDMNTALRKAERTQYWLRLLYDGGFLEKEEFADINADDEELIRMLTSITKNTQY